MKIPKKIQIAGKVFDVIIDGKQCSAEGCYGRLLNERNQIILDDIKKSGVCIEKIEQTFLHECVHVIQSIMNRDYDEDFATTGSELLYQIIKQIS